MTDRREPGSFEDFVAWLGRRDRPGQPDHFQPSPEVMSAAREAWQSVRAVENARLKSILERIAADSYRENIELLAAADVDKSRWLPRLRTPNGFAISALYAAEAAPGADPVGLLVECPAALIDVCRGRLVHIAIGGRWIEIGEVDQDGKAVGDLPAGLHFKPPFAFRVGTVDEATEELREGDDPS
jgi:hypothetical protein